MDSETSVYYSQNASRLAEQYATVVHTLEDCLTSVFARSHKILDVGCGTGRDLSFLLGNGKDAYGVDPSRKCSLPLIKHFERGASQAKADFSWVRSQI
jgi:SAM-dependent methyltransferase